MSPAMNIDDQRSILEKAFGIKPEDVDGPSTLDRTIQRLDRFRDRCQEAGRKAANTPDAWGEGDVDTVKGSQPSKLLEEDANQKRRRWYGRCGVPKIYQGCTRSTWQGTWKKCKTPWDARLRSWRGDPSILVLSGEPRLGKTHMAVAMMAEWAKCDERRQIMGGTNLVRFVSVLNACSDLADWYRHDVKKMVRGLPLPEYYNMIAKTFGLVVYDDIGAQPDRENWSTVVSNWIYLRHQSGLPSIFTINPSEVVGLDDRAAGRLREGLVINLDRLGE